MPEPSDPLSARLAAAPGLATLLDEARATWLARAECETDRATTVVDADSDSAVGESTVASVDPPDSVDSPDSAADPAGPAKPPVRVRPSTPRWRAFEDAFPTFYQFTNRPRG